MFSDILSASNALAVVLFALGILVTLAMRSKSELRYHFAEVTIVGGHQPEFENDLTVLFEGITVPRVTKTTVTIWNSGNTTLYPRNFAPLRPLSIEIPGGRLRAIITESSDPETAPVLPALSETDVKVGFDFLKPRDGFVVEIIHQGGLKECRIQGNLMDAKRGLVEGHTWSIVHALRDPAKNNTQRAMIIAQNLMFTFGIFYLATAFVGLGVSVGIYYTTGKKTPPPFPEDVLIQYPWPLTVYLMSLAMLTVFLHWRTYRQAPNFTRRIKTAQSPQYMNS